MRGDAPPYELLPKIDLHVHLEGSLPRATLKALATRHRLDVPRLTKFDGFHGFLKSFGAVCDLLRDSEDFERAAGDLLVRALRIGVVHIEVLFSPQVFMRRGIAAATMMRGLLRARRRAVARPGFSMVYILDGVRQWGGEWFDRTVQELAPWAGRGLAGVGVGGDEVAIPARAFVKGFQRARRLGLSATIHAGEAGGPASVRAALRWLRPDRIGHGIRAVEDAGLMREIAARRVTLEVCPSSNIVTGLVPSWSGHPLRRLRDAGVPVTINSDDGTFFQTDTAIELRRAARHLALTRSDLMDLQLNAARAAFLPASERRLLERRILGVWGRGASVRGERRMQFAGSAT